MGAALVIPGNGPDCGSTRAGALTFRFLVCFRVFRVFRGLFLLTLAPAPSLPI